MTVFGELCGGLYRHQDVQRVKEATRVQGRVDYSPDNEWIPFDLLLRDPEQCKSMVLNLDTLAKLCKQVGLLCEIEEFRGTLRECLERSPVYIDDTGQRLWSLPLIEGNVGEGFVVKPIEAQWLPNGSRVIVKSKNPKFKERIRASKAQSLELKGKLNELEEKWLETLSEYMNESRVMSAVSKLGEITKDSFGDLMREACTDALSDFKKDNGEELEKLQRSMDPKDFDFSKITKAFNRVASAAVREVFLREIS